MRGIFESLVRGLTGFPVAVGRGQWRVLVPRLVAFGLTVLVLFLTWSGHLYPLRPDAIKAIGHPFTSDRIFDHAWGGPTLIGAWFVHSMAALGLQVICLRVIRWCSPRVGSRWGS